MSRGRWLGALLVMAVLALGACTPDGQVPPPKKASPPASPVELSLVVYGAPSVVAAYQKVATDFTVEHPLTHVRVTGYPDHAHALAAVRSAVAAGHPPNLFLIERSDLDGLMADGALRHVDDLLSARQVDFGDGYARDPLEAFSADRALQCMPTQVSPMVVYYNPRLVDLATLPEPGQRPIDQTSGWTMDQFVKAARRASHGTKRGVYIAPTIEQVAPFVFSGGGSVVDSTAKPSHLTLSSGKSATALQKLLELVRDPQLTFSRQELSTQGPLQRFERGQLGMMLGYRDLTPVLRAHKGLAFDVMPLPKIGRQATVGQSAGVCVGKGTENLSQTADFLAYLVSDDGAKVLADTGYVMPTNLEVTTSTDFIQPTRLPVHGGVFTDQTRNIKPLPYGPAWSVAKAQADRALVRLFYDPVITPLGDRLGAIDDDSRRVLSPSPSPSPSGSPSESPSGSATP